MPALTVTDAGPVCIERSVNRRVLRWRSLTGSDTCYLATTPTNCTPALGIEVKAGEGETLIGERFDVGNPLYFICGTGDTAEIRYDEI